MGKIFSAFISSTSAVSEYRKKASNTLRSSGFYCHEMEKFKVHKFDKIKEFIKDSDFVLLILGTDYGSICGETNKSFTQSEFEFACEIGKPVMVVTTPEFGEALVNKTGADEAQLDFYKLVVDRGFLPCCIDEDTSVSEILSQYISNSKEEFPGWSRNEISGAELEKWAAENAAYNLNGIWYHFHFSETDRSYVRLGNIKIEQNFTPSGFRKCKFVGQNYGVKTDENKKIILNENGVPEIDRTHHTTWEGEYTLQQNGATYTGIYSTRRSYAESNFAGQKKNNQVTRGIHDYDVDYEDIHSMVNFFQGEFHDEAPSVKQGKISVFRNEADRNAKVVEYLEKYGQISK